MSDTLLTNGAPHARQPLPEATRGSAILKVASAARPVAGSRRGAEPYDALLWRLQSRQADGVESIALGLIGCEDRTGATTVATNLAVRASELGMGPVLLIEADADRPRIADAWRLGAGPGLFDALSGSAPFADCFRKGPALGLNVVTAHGGSLLSADWDATAIDALLTEARADHRLVLLDLPAANRLHGALLLARRLDEVLLVVRSERSRRQAIERAADRLIGDGVPLAGAILNRRRTYLPRWLAGSR